MNQRAATVDLVVVRERLSPARLRPYEQAVGHDLARAMDMYLWNTDISAAFYAVLQGVEVVVRNAISEQMEVLHRANGYLGTWFDDPFDFLDDRHHDEIAQARVLLQRGRYPVTQDGIITALPFGFWRYLLSVRYEHTLWIPALRKAFPYAPRGQRRYVAARVERLNHLRNRIAHHEPIYPRRLRRDMEEALDVVAAIDPMCGSWVESYSWVSGLLANPVPAPRRGTP